MKLNNLTPRADDMQGATFPLHERGALLRIVTMPIVDGRDPTLDVVQNLAHDESRDSNSGHQTRGRAPQIMKAEIDFRILLHAPNRLLEVRNRSSDASATEHVGLIMLAGSQG